MYPIVCWLAEGEGARAGMLGMKLKVPGKEKLSPGVARSCRVLDRNNESTEVYFRFVYSGLYR
jgi:hypothetical protein